MSRAEDLRPPVWIGHVRLPTPDVPATNAFMLKLGMRPILARETVAVLELRGGTHLVLVPADGPQSGDAEFDLMVEDLAATHAKLAALGLSPSEIEKGRIHDSFSVRSPSGHCVKFNSTHVSDQPV